jgi:simple sugar transport system permease protein
VVAQLGRDVPDEFPAASDRHQADTARQRPRVARTLLARPEGGAILGTVLLWALFAALGGDNGFLSVPATAGILEVAAQIGIVGTSVSLLMIAGHFDLSVGSMVGATGMILALALSEFGLSVWVAVALALTIGVAVGLLNGLLVVKTGLPSFVVTLASFFVLRGATIVLARDLTGLTVVGGLDKITADDPVASLFNFRAGEFRVSILWWVGLVAVSAYVLHRSRLGNWIYTTGDAPAAARMVGVPTNRVVVTMFMYTAFCAALLACLQVLTFHSADALRGQQKEFEAITTAVIGGTLLKGGYGTALGPVFGAISLAVVQLGIFYAGIDTDWYKIVLGLLLLAAVAFNDNIRRLALRSTR